MCRRVVRVQVLVAFAVLALLADRGNAEGRIQKLWEDQKEKLRLGATVKGTEEALKYLKDAPESNGEAKVAGMPNSEGLRNHLADTLGKSKLLDKHRKDDSENLNTLLKKLQEEGAILLEGSTVNGRPDSEGLEQVWKRDLALRLREAEFRGCYECELGETPALLPRGHALARLTLWGGLVLLIGLLFALSWLTRQRRPLWRASPLRPGLVFCSVVALGVAGAVVWLAEEGRSWMPIPWLLDAEQERLKVLGDRERELRELIRKGTAAAQKWNERFDAANEARRTRQAARLAISPEAYGRLEGNTFDLLRDILIQIQINEEASKRIASLSAEAEVRRQRLAEAQGRNAVLLRQRAWVRWGLIAVAAVVALLPWLGVVVWLSLRRPDRRCPRCVSPSRLVGAEPSCPACGYRILKTQARLTRLCFPTFGRRESGKTHWLVEFLHQVRQTHPPTGLSLQAVPSAEEERCNNAAARIWKDRLGPDRTDYQADALPAPLVFEVQVSGADEALLHLFDLCGEVSDQPACPARERALEMNGGLFFLDVHQNGAAQSQVLQSFLADLRRKKTAPGGPIPAPLAVCLSRLDLALMRQGGDWADWIVQLRSTARARFDLEVIYQRSDLIEQRIEALFPGDLPGLLRRELGDNFLFFPVSAAGIDLDGGLPKEPGPDALRGRRLLPFGIMEPVLWLLHRHGYPVFDRSQRRGRPT